MKQRIMWVLWPAFVVAAVTEMLFFAFIDPGSSAFGHPLESRARRPTRCSSFFFWAIGRVLQRADLFSGAFVVRDR
jgi:hypothetical protein